MIVRAHVAVGIAIGGLVAVAVGQSPQSLVVALPVAVAASALPDVLDSNTQAGRRYVGLSSKQITRDANRAIKRGGVEAVLGTAVALVRTLLAAVLDTISHLIPHRGLTHWMLTCVCLSVMIGVGAMMVQDSVAVAALAALSFFGGYLTHLLADSMTIAGVKLLAPFYNRPLHLLPKPLRFRFDSPVQWFVVAMVWGGVVLLAGEVAVAWLGAP